MSTCISEGVALVCRQICVNLHVQEFLEKAERPTRTHLNRIALTFYLRIIKHLLLPFRMYDSRPGYGSAPDTKEEGKEVNVYSGTHKKRMSGYVQQ